MEPTQMEFLGQNVYKVQNMTGRGEAGGGAYAPPRFWQNRRRCREVAARRITKYLPTQTFRPCAIPVND